MGLRQNRLDLFEKKRLILLLALISFVFIFLIFSFGKQVSADLSSKEICDGIDNDKDGLIDEGEKIFTLDLETPPDGPSITGLGWTDQCKESCSPFCSTVTKNWHDGEIQPGNFFDSSFEGEVIAELTLRTVGFSEESFRPNQHNEVVEATINGVVFGRTEDNCNKKECQCNIEEKTSSRIVTLKSKSNHVTVREVEDSIGMKSAKAVFYKRLCEDENVKLKIISPKENEIFNENQNIPIKVKVENKHLLKKLEYVISSSETKYSSGSKEDLEFNKNSGLHEKDFNLKENNISKSGSYNLEAVSKDKTDRESKDNVDFCIDLDKPEAPKNFTFTKNERDVFLKWAESKDNPTCSGISNYNLFRNSEFIGNTKNLSFEDKNLSLGKYNYTLIAVDLAGHESLKAQLSVTIEKKKSSSGGGGGGGPVFECGEWGKCINGISKRICTEVSTLQNKTETRECIPQFVPLNADSGDSINLTTTLDSSKKTSNFGLSGTWILSLILLILILILALILIFSALSKGR